MFSHGLGASPELYMPLLRKLAAAGFVVAAPWFPLSNSKTPGGPDAGDVVNQPGDISYVLTQVLRAANEKNGTLAGLVNPDQVAVAGHSNGAITTLGLAANTCCRDRRAKAAVVMAGTAENYPGGRYDFTTAPPILIVHGTNDALIPYDEGVAVFNRARGPKGLLTIRNGDHGSAAAITGADKPVIVRTVVDFLDSALRGGNATGGRLFDEAKSSMTSLKYVAQPGSTETIPTVPTPKANLHAAVNPSTNLSGGQKVTVRWSGYTPGKVVNVLQCSASDRDLSNSTGCDFSKAALLHPDATGAGSLQLEIVEGKVGNSVCDATHQGCFIVVNNASSPDPAASVKLPITFAS
jgi:predicted esterase